MVLTQHQDVSSTHFSYKNRILNSSCHLSFLCWKREQLFEDGEVSARQAKDAFWMFCIFISPKSLKTFSELFSFKSQSKQCSVLELYANLGKQAFFFQFTEGFQRSNQIHSFALKPSIDYTCLLPKQPIINNKTSCCLTPCATNAHTLDGQLMSTKICSTL